LISDKKVLIMQNHPQSHLQSLVNWQLRAVTKEASQ
jgi:hypothetical protein